MKKVIMGMVYILLSMVFSGCGVTANNEISTEKSIQSYENMSEKQPSVALDDSTTFDNIITLDSIPEYDGEPYVEIYGNIPNYNIEEKSVTEPFEIYSDLDMYGRCGKAYANICLEIMPTEERGNIGGIKPSGWHTIKYNDLIDGNYLYNRCHLIAYQLAGENANERNLITGTRYLNTIGMLAFESRVYDYVVSTKNHVLYRVTPIFEGDNLVASGVELEAWSVEDNGEGVCFHVYCYNVQPGIAIDYATGESWESEV